MSKSILFAAAGAALFLGGSYVFSGTPTCAPSRADILNSQRPEAKDTQVISAPTCAPSRADILNSQSNPG